MTDKIIVRSLKAPSIIGVIQWEREVRQELLLDLDIFFDTKAAGSSDDLELTLDYAVVSELLIEECAQSSFQLLEALAAHLIEKLFENFPIDSVKLTIKKPGAVPQADYVGVEIKRTRPSD